MAMKKIGFYTFAHIMRHKKYDYPFGKPENKVVIDKTCVGGAVLAFHGRNCLPTKNLKAEYLEFC